MFDGRHAKDGEILVKLHSLAKFFMLGLSSSSLVVLSACGGGGGGDNSFTVDLPVGEKNNPPTISGTAPQASEDSPYSFAPTMDDEDNDPVQVSVSSLPAWLQYNSSNHAISGTPSAKDLGQTPEITYTVSDGTDSAEMTFRVLVNYDNIKQALRTGDHRYVEQPNDFIDHAQKLISETAANASAIRTPLFNLASNGQAKSDGSSVTAISWVPTHDAAQLIPSFGRNHDVLVSNATSDSNYQPHPLSLGIAGDEAGENRDARFLALGGNPMRNYYRDNNSLNEDMHQFIKNSIEWLVGRDNFSSEPLRVVISQMEQGYYFPDRVANREWLDERYPSQVEYNTAASCDGTALAGCLTDDIDLLLISQVTADSAQDAATMSAVTSWLAAGKPVFYVHNDGDLTPLGDEILNALNVRYLRDNYWWRLSFENYDVTNTGDGTPEDIKQIAALIQRFEDQNFSVDFSGCENHSCPDGSGFDEQFLTAAQALQSQLESLDEKGQRIFEHQDLAFLKSVLLLADKYRQEVSYPMDKTSTPQLDFLKSYFADHAVYNLRKVNPAQADMGNFSRSDFSHITPVNKAVSLTSKRHSRSAGVYALPGQTVRVTRTDNSAVNTTVFVNLLRSGATHQFDNNAYNRPKFLRSEGLPIAAGETVEFTSSYGGPVQIGFDSNDQQVTFNFENVGEHPYWSNSAHDTSFQEKLDAGEYDWAEVATSGFEVHSKLDKMRDSIGGGAWSDAAALAAGAERYMSNLPHVLAGYQGPGIDVVPEIHNFANAKGWTIETIDLVKHMNADQATCGYGCSGNPYDAYWSYSPQGHGDLHELGHGLEQGAFRFEGWPGHAVTNPYSYYSKSQYHIDTGGDPNCQSLPFESLKQTLQESRNQSDPFAYMQAADLTGWSDGVAISIQMMMSVQDQGVLENGWHLLARLHILHREFRRADNSDEAWEAQRASLGFSMFTRQEANALNNNDWLAISFSIVAERDMGDYLRMWGLEVGAEASAQIASLGYPALPTQFFDSTATGYCENMSPAKIAIN